VCCSETCKEKLEEIPDYEVITDVLVWVILFHELGIAFKTADATITVDRALSCCPASAFFCGFFVASIG
jgi:hypothetical protein